MPPTSISSDPFPTVGDGNSSAVQSQTIQSSQTPTLTPAALEQASKYAIQVGKEISSYSKLVDNRDEIPLLEREEVVLGDLLGTGGFNNVYEVHAIELLDDESDNSQNPTSGGQQKSKQKPHSELTSTPSQISARRALAKLGGGSLAVKFLNESCKVSSQEYANGAADLVLETRYLSALSSYPHPNIIRLHGVAAAGPEGFATGAEGAYFLVLDRLSDTLDGRIEVWKELERRKKANLTPEFELHLKALYAKQIQVGVDLASALAHLHKLRIIFRDLKPENIGFDAKGVLKLFDFGLAKELDNRQKNATGLYEMSGGTGSRRYMAPEVSRSEPYYLSADMYSYGVVLWETLSFQKAYWDMTLEEHDAKVVNGDHERPKLLYKWPVAIQTLLEGCWHKDPAQRPPAKHVHMSLQKELDSFGNQHGIRVRRLKRSNTT